MKYATYTYANHSIQKEAIRFQNTRIDHYIITCTKPRTKKTSNSEFTQVLNTPKEYWCHPEKDNRDYQRQRLYNAENKALRKFRKKFKDHAEASRFIAKVLKSDWFINHFPISTVSMKTTLRNDICATGRGMAHKDAHISRIKIPDWALSDHIILHEIAHTLNSRSYGSGHGRRFCFIFLYLVKKFMGKEAGHFLEREFKKSGIDYWKFGTSAEHLQDDYCPF